MLPGASARGPVLPDAAGRAGARREGLALVRSQVHGPVRLPAERRQRDVARVHAVHRVHLAADARSPGRVPVQRAIPAPSARSRVLVSVRHVRRQLREGSARPQSNRFSNALCDFADEELFSFGAAIE